MINFESLYLLVCSQLMNFLKTQLAFYVILNASYEGICIEKITHYWFTYFQIARKYLDKLGNM